MLTDTLTHAITDAVHPLTHHSITFYNIPCLLYTRTLTYACPRWVHRPCPFTIYTVLLPSGIPSLDHLGYPLLNIYINFYLFIWLLPCIIYYIPRTHTHTFDYSMERTNTAPPIHKH